MLKNEQNPGIAAEDDISALWGPREDALEPIRPAPRDAETARAPSAESNGSGLPSVDSGPHQAVAEVAGAIAARQVDPAGRAEMNAARSALEGAFTQQLAVAQYELMAASTDRLATAEEHINERLHEMAERIAELVTTHSERLAASIERVQLSSVEALQAVGAELAAVRSQLAGRSDASTGLGPHVRLAVGRLADLVPTRRAELAPRADAEPETLAATRAELWERLEQSEARTVKAASQFSEVSERIAAVQADVATLHEAVAELRQAVESQDKTSRGGSRRSA